MFGIGVCMLIITRIYKNKISSIYLQIKTEKLGGILQVISYLITIVLTISYFFRLLFIFKQSYVIAFQMIFVLNLAVSFFFPPDTIMNIIKNIINHIISNNKESKIKQTKSWTLMENINMNQNIKISDKVLSNGFEILDQISNNSEELLFHKKEYEVSLSGNKSNNQNPRNSGDLLFRSKKIESIPSGITIA